MKIKKLLLGVICVFALCLMDSCVKEAEYGQIHGIVTDANTNEPIQGVNMSLSPSGASTVTGSDGRYEFMVAPGQYTLQAVKKGYESNTKTITVEVDKTVFGDMMLKPEVASFKLNVDYLDFGTNLNSLPFKISSTTNSLPVNWSVTNSNSWLSATPNSGTLQPGQEIVVTVVIDRNQIQQSITANITVESEGQTVVLPVNVTVSGSSGPKLQVSTNSIDFGTSANALPFYVMNSGPASTSLHWVCSPINVDWLILTPTSGDTPGAGQTAVMATIDRNKIDGIVSTQVTISGAGSSETISFTASSEGSGVAILQLSEGSIDFGDTDLTKQFQVKNVGSSGTVLDWSFSIPAGVDWLSFTPFSGSTNAGSGTQVTAVVDRTKFTGVVSTTVTVNSSANSATLLVSAANVESVLVVNPEDIDFGGAATSMTLTIKNAGDEGSNMSWSIATPSVSWLTASPMSGTVAANHSTNVTLTVDRTLFTGIEHTSIQVTGGGKTKTVNIAVDNSVIVTNGLFCYFNFDDPNNIVDWAGNYTGINAGAVASTDTPSGEGNSMQFNGENASILVQDNIVPGGSSFSINLWFKTGRNNQWMLGTDTYHSYDPNSALGFDENSHVYYRSGAANNPYWITTNAATNYIDNRWHMITLTYDGNLAMVYFDGVLFESKVKDNYQWGTNVNASYFGVANSNQGNVGFYNGRLDNFRSYNRALSASEIQQLFNAKQ